MKRNWIKGIVSLLAVTSMLAAPALSAKADTVTTITRSQVEQRAQSMINLVWTYNAAKNGTLSSQYGTYITQVKQLQGVTTAQETGIPYDWGGFDGLDSHSYNEPWTSFLNAVNNGAYTGNVNSSGGIGYVPGTAGLDCSGFVQAVYNIQDYKQSTTSLLNKYFTPINLSDIKHMDILDKPGDHVVIFDKWGTFNGINGAFTYEATPDQTYGGIQGTKRYFISMNTINKGYIAARYMNVVDDPVTQTAPTASTTPTVTITGTSTITPAVTTTGTTSTAPATTSTGTSTTTPEVNLTGTTTTSTLATPQFKIGGYAQVSNVTSYGNLRANPSTDAAILTTVPKGAILNLVDFSDGWYKVSYNGQTGWMSGSLLGAAPETQSVNPTVTPQFKVGGYAQVANVTSYGNLRANATTDATILTTVPKETILNLIDYSNGWYKVSYNGQTGWMSGSLFGAVPAGQFVTVNNVYQLNMRMIPSGTAQIVGVLTQGQIAQKLDQTADGSWFKISINGVQGWSSAKYLTFIQ